MSVIKHILVTFSTENNISVTFGNKEIFELRKKYNVHLFIIEWISSAILHNQLQINNLFEFRESGEETNLFFQLFKLVILCNKINPQRQNKVDMLIYMYMYSHQVDEYF